MHLSLKHVLSLLVPSFLHRPSIERKPLRDTAYLDGLRGLAAVSVYLTHTVGCHLSANVGYGQEHAHYDFIRLPFIRLFYGSGHISVALFFIISGHVLSLRAFEMLERKHGNVLELLSSAALRRFIRLFLPLLACSFTSMLLTRLGWPLPVFKPEHSTFAEFIRYIRYSVLRSLDVYNNNGQSQMALYDPYNPVNWTIPVEFRCSLLVYLMIVLLSNVQNSTHKVYILALASVHAFLTDFWSGACFYFGMLMAQLDAMRNSVLIVGQEPEKVRPSSKTGIHIFTLLVGLYLCSAPAPVDFDDAALGYGLLYQLIPQSLFLEPFRFYGCIGAMLVYVAITNLKLCRSVLCFSPVQYLGQISYSFYLWHNIVNMGVASSKYYLGNILFDRFHVAIAFSHINHFVLINAVGQLMIFPILIFIADLFHRGVDEPSVALAKRFERWLARSST